jgi:hypothetical protein
MLRIGRTAAYMLSALRSATLTELKPPPTGVVHGPLMPTPCWRIAAKVSAGRSSFLPASSAASPARNGRNSTGAPAAKTISVMAALTSGPMPSPGMSTTLCVTGCFLRKSYRREIATCATARCQAP